MFVSKRGKFDVFDDKKKRVPTELDGIVKPQVADHMQNWIDSAKNGTTPNAPLDVANCTTTAIHLGNISTRLQRSLVFDAGKQQVVDDAEANALLSASTVPRGIGRYPGRPSNMAGSIATL